MLKEKLVTAPVTNLLIIITYLLDLYLPVVYICIITMDKHEVNS